MRVHTPCFSLISASVMNDSGRNSLPSGHRFSLLNPLIASRSFILKIFSSEVKTRNRILINDLLNVLLVIYFMCMKDFHFEALGKRFKKSIKISLILAPSMLHFYILITQKML
jgi:hypothetical protein